MVTAAVFDTPVPNWWKYAVMAISALLALAALYNLAANMIPDLVGPNTPSGSGCPSLGSDCGLGSVVAPQCNCPSNCGGYTIISNPASMKGYKQCYP